jgi:hypothetical protein
MQTREIPNDGWADFLNNLSEAHRDERVRVEVGGEPLGEQPLVEGLTLMGLSLDPKGSEAGTIDVAINTPQGVLDHRIEKPEHVWVEENDAGGLACIDIEDQEHVKTLIYFQPEQATAPRH